MDKNINQPLVTILLPVYNGEKYIEEAIESILGQTYKRFEFLIIDDGSTDNTNQIINKYKIIDNRIINIFHNKNKGLVFSLNEGIKEARGKYIARMDADDISCSGRIKEQVAFMEKNIEFDICGTWAQAIDENGKNLFKMKSPTGLILKYNYWKPSPLIHPSVMVRRSKLEKYSDRYPRAEDYELWLRMRLNGCNIANISKELFKYRINCEGISKSGVGEQRESSFKAFSDLYMTKINITTYLSLVCLKFELTSWKRFKEIRKIFNNHEYPVWFLLIDTLYYSLRRIIFCFFPHLQTYR